MAEKADVIVLGAGIVGVSIAIHLQLLGRQTLLVDRGEAGGETSFGNAGMIQSEAAMPYLFPRSPLDLLRYARNRSIDAVFQPAALPGLAEPFARYWHASSPSRALASARARAPLFNRSIADHRYLAELSGAQDLLRPTGWTKVFRSPAPLERAMKHAQREFDELGIRSVLLDADELARHEPVLARDLSGALHWPEPLTCPDPFALTQALLARFLVEGGRFRHGDAQSLEEGASHWQLRTPHGALLARDVVIALGPWSPVVTRTLGYRAPFFVKRGYHRHFSTPGGGGLHRPVLDAEHGYVLAPMRAGTRLTSGAEFARPGAPSNDIQIERATPKARKLFPGLGVALDARSWMGSRPCLPDMVPVIGPAPGRRGAWFAFGHAHHGLTLGPTTGWLVARMIAGKETGIDPFPYRAERFRRR